jgi:tetratricopeptide (TPR) repeat protein
MEGRDTRDGVTEEGGPAAAITGSPDELYELGGRLLERGDARQAAEVFATALAQLDAQAEAGTEAGPPAAAAGAREPARGQLLAGLGIARLEQALAAFREAADCGGADVRPLAVELLARALPLRDRDDEAARAWQRGLEDPDPDTAAAVRARLRRAFGAGYRGGAADGAGTAGTRSWWDGFLESAVCHGTLPLLANELFGALDHMYAVVAVPYARASRSSRTRARELREALAEAVRLPGGYAWGAELQESFRGRLREAMGADSDVLPPGWPDG